MFSSKDVVLTNFAKAPKDTISQPTSVWKHKKILLASFHNGLTSFKVSEVFSKLLLLSGATDLHDKHWLKGYLH